jgi:hypothetical protein
MTVATPQVEPVTPRSIQDEDESVRIAVRALGDMRNGAVLRPPAAHPPSISCARFPYIPLCMYLFAHRSPYQPFSLHLPSPSRLPPTLQR